jgi:hypothetical protein
MVIHPFTIPQGHHPTMAPFPVPPSIHHRARSFKELNGDFLHVQADFLSKTSWLLDPFFSPQFLANIYHIIPHLNITGAGHSFEQSNEGYEYFNPGFNLAKTNLRVPAKNSWHYFLIWLVVYLPLWKIWVRQLGSIIIFPTEWKKRIPVPNHQPVIDYPPVSPHSFTLLPSGNLT